MGKLRCKQEYPLNYKLAGSAHKWPTGPEGFPIEQHPQDTLWRAIPQDVGFGDGEDVPGQDHGKCMCTKVHPYHKL